MILELNLLGFENKVQVFITNFGILFPKLFWPIVRKKLFFWSKKTSGKIEAEGQNIAEMS